MKKKNVRTTQTAVKSIIEKESTQKSIKFGKKSIN